MRALNSNLEQETATFFPTASVFVPAIGGGTILLSSFVNVILGNLAGPVPPTNFVNGLKQKSGPQAGNFLLSNFAQIFLSAPMFSPRHGLGRLLMLKFCQMRATKVLL